MKTLTKLAALSLLATASFAAEEKQQDKPLKTQAEMVQMQTQCCLEHFPNMTPQEREKLIIENREIFMEYLKQVQKQNQRSDD